MTVEKNHGITNIFPFSDYINTLADLADAAKNANLTKVATLLDEAVLLAILEIENMNPAKSSVKIISHSDICDYSNVVLFRPSSASRF